MSGGRGRCQPDVVDRWGHRLGLGALTLSLSLALTLALALALALGALTLSLTLTLTLALTRPADDAHRKGFASLEATPPRPNPIPNTLH